MYSVVLPEPKIRNGARYYDLLVTPTTSHLTTATVDDKQKLVFHDSKFAIGLVTDSWKYGSEVQFISFSRKAPKIKRRVDKDHEYYRVECGYLPATHETAELLRGVADKIDAILGYSYHVHTELYRGPEKQLTEKSDLVELL
jgi:hypothetical protein